MSRETRWWWIRHAPVTAHEGRVYGNCDHPCDTSDRATFQGLARVLPKGALWVTSDLIRTHQTADAIADEMTPPEGRERLIERDLQEQSFGDWHGLTHDELRAERQGEWHRFWLAPAEERPPGGESFADVMARVSATVERLNRAHAGRDIIAVAHGGVIRAAIGLALDLPADRALSFTVDNCALTRMDHFAGSNGSHAPEVLSCWRVARINGHPGHFL